MTKRFEDEDWSGARLRNVDLSRARGVEVNLDHADLSGYIGGLRINGIEVGPLIHAEMERRYPERKKLYASDQAGFRDGLSILEGLLDQTWTRARKLTEEQRNERVEDEWSVVETVRHLVFVIDGWVSGIIGGEKVDYHPIGLPPSFLPPKPSGTAIDPGARPPFEEALAVWDGRLALLGDVVGRLTSEELKRPIDHPHAKDVRAALWVVFDEIWHHNYYTNRDMSTLESA